MRALRENVVPVSFLAVWMAVSVYTIDALAGMHTTRRVGATVDVTVSAPVQASAPRSCLHQSARAAVDI